MIWGTVELEPEVRDWFEGLSATQFATAAFYVDLLAEQGPLLSEPYTRQLDGKWPGGRCGDVLPPSTQWTMTARSEAMRERRSDWQELRSRRMAEPGAVDAYDAARLAYELGRRVRELRVEQGLSQTELARRAGMTQPAVARFEAGGTVPTLPVLERLARSLGAELTVQLAPSSSVA